MAVLLLKLFPAVFENSTVVIETNEKHLGAPAQSVPNVIWRGVAAREWFFTVRAIMFLLDDFITAFIHKHFPATSGKTLMISKISAR
jgi:hypothetical protein